MSNGASPDPGSRRFALGVLARLAIVAVTVGAVGFLLLNVTWRKPALTDRDAVILTDFANTTGDVVFDRALRQALALHLEQSPYFNVVPADRVSETLRAMNRAGDEPVTEALGREICQRRGARALIAGAIAGPGPAHVVTLRALRCDSGEMLAATQVQARSREDVLDALSTASSSIRRDLGESPASIKQYAVPLQAAATGSLAALEAFSQGEARRRAHALEALRFYQRAIELDPDFALAHARLSTIHSTIADPRRALEHAVKAYALKDRVSERERFYITARYQDELGDLEALEPTLRLWAATFPRMPEPRNDLSLMLAQNGRYAEAVQPALDAIQVDPAAPSGYANLAGAYAALDRLREADGIAQEGIRRFPGGADSYLRLASLAFMRGDQAAIDTWLEAGTTRSIPAVMLEMRARIAGATGQLRRMDGMAQQAIAEGGAADTGLARRIGAEAAISHAAFGDLAGAERWLASIPAVESATGNERVGLALAAIGDARRVEAMVAAPQYPSRRARELVGPMALATLAVSKGDGARALQALQSIPAIYRRRTDVAFVRGATHALLGQHREALAEFDRVLAVRGGVEPDVAVTRAYLGRARALAQLGDAEPARAAYDLFLVRCAAADVRLPLIEAARAERAR